MLYHWIGVKPLRRTVPVYGQRGKERHVMTGTAVQLITRQDPPFEPSEWELRSFGDLMEPVGLSLRADEAPQQGEQVEDA